MLYELPHDALPFHRRLEVEILVGFERLYVTEAAASLHLFIDTLVELFVDLVDRTLPLNACASHNN